MVGDEEWEPLSAADVAALGRPVVARGFLRLNKPALARLIEVLGHRPGTGYRDLTVLLGLLTVARFSGKQYEGADGVVPGSDAELARVIDVEPSMFRRSVDELVDRSYLTRLSADRPAGYRVTRPVWEWLQAEDMPPEPSTLDEVNPFAGSRRSRPTAST